MDEFDMSPYEWARICSEPFETAPRRYELSYRLGLPCRIHCDVGVLTDDRRFWRGPWRRGGFSEVVPPLHEAEQTPFGWRAYEGVRRLRFGGLWYEGPEVETLAQKVAQECPIREGDEVCRIAQDLGVMMDSFSPVYITRLCAPSESLFKELLEKYSKE
ncbi:hypothetical protein KY362_01850 [Candidatus Woesearchaeota archaeon]|nr:hypothetical protein [Candidatus Woesearchaeota archaeon]